MRKSMRDKRTLIIASLLVIVLVMTVGFAAFANTLTINGTANISTNWCVGFDNTQTSSYTITKGLASGTNPTASMSYSGTACSTNYVPVATLGAGFYQPGDKVEYTLTIANKGSMAAVIESITVDNTSVTSDQTITKGNIIWKVYMPASTTLAATTGTTTMVVSAEFQNNTNISTMTSGESQTIAIGINTTQDDGSGGFTPTPSAQTVYAINTNSIYKNSSTLQDIGTTYNSCSATGKNICLKYTIENDTVTGAEVCFIKGGNEYCLKGWVDECLYDGTLDDCTFTGTKTVYNANKGVLNTAFTEANACSDGDRDYHCSASGVDASAGNEGFVRANDGSWICYVSDDGDAYCSDGK